MLLSRITYTPGQALHLMALRDAKTKHCNIYNVCVFVCVGLGI